MCIIYGCVEEFSRKLGGDSLQYFYHLGQQLYMILVCLHGPIKNNIISIDQMTLKVYLTMQKHLATHKKAAFTVSGEASQFCTNQNK